MSSSTSDPAPPPRLRPGEIAEGEDPSFLTRQLLTYIGNKRSLLKPIDLAVEQVKRRLGKPRLRILDGFSGSGVVSRSLKAHASELVANDIEDYARVVSECFLTNRSTVPTDLLRETVAHLNAAVADAPLAPGFFERLYAPHDENAITADDRVFYTPANARRLDNYRRLIDLSPPEIRPLLLGPLLSEASVHANTAGVFKGFYKDKDTGLGKFGGKGADALTRILGPITLEPPVLSRFECEAEVVAYIAQGPSWRGSFIQMLVPTDAATRRPLAAVLRASVLPTLVFEQNGV